jgi:hypothetical protein
MKTKPKPRARRMWANYYADESCRLLNTRASAKRYAAFGSVETAAIPVAVIPLHDLTTLGDSMVSALTTLGVLRKKGTK